jgi:hypothetical protein
MHGMIASQSTSGPRSSTTRVIPFRVPSASVTASVGRRPSPEGSRTRRHSAWRARRVRRRHSQVDVDSSCVHLLHHSADQGEHELKGVPDKWRLFAVKS